MMHLSLIKTYCEVIAEKANAIWYVDGGYKYADVYDSEEGWISYSCNSEKEWEMLTEQGAFFYFSLDFFGRAPSTAARETSVYHVRRQFVKQNFMKIL